MHLSANAPLSKELVMTDLSNNSRACPFCKEDIKTGATRCIHCLADIPAGANGRARPPVIQGRRIRAFAHRVPTTAPVAIANNGPSSACNDLEIDDAGVWEYIGEDENYCYYWGPS
jgi:hypothetical protein